jgi:hypothetical protein
MNLKQKDAVVHRRLDGEVRASVCGAGRLRPDVLWLQGTFITIRCTERKGINCSHKLRRKYFNGTAIKRGVCGSRPEIVCMQRTLVASNERKTIAIAIAIFALFTVDTTYCEESG